MKYTDINGDVYDPAQGVRQPYVHEICFNCHGDGFATMIPANKFLNSQPLRTSTGAPASSYTYGSNKRREFDPASVGSQADDMKPGLTENSSYHPVGALGRTDRGLNTPLNRQLRSMYVNLGTDDTMTCTDCHNSDETQNVKGVITRWGLNNGRGTDTLDNTPSFMLQGPHGSKPTPSTSIQCTLQCGRGQYKI